MCAAREVSVLGEIKKLKVDDVLLEQILGALRTLKQSRQWQRDGGQIYASADMAESEALGRCQNHGGEKE